MEQRGCPETLALVVVGVTSSRGQPRVPQLKRETWAAISKQLLETSSRIVLHTDGLQTYDSVAHPAIVDKHSANHREQIFARSVELLRFVEPRKTEPGLTGTMVIDREWRALKKDVPDLPSRTERERAIKLMYIRASQFKRMHRGKDLWPIFCGAVRELRQKGEGLADKERDGPVELPDQGEDQQEHKPARKRKKLETSPPPLPAPGGVPAAAVLLELQAVTAQCRAAH